MTLPHKMLFITSCSAGWHKSRSPLLSPTAPATDVFLSCFIYSFFNIMYQPLFWIFKVSSNVWRFSSFNNIYFPFFLDSLQNLLITRHLNEFYSHSYPYLKILFVFWLSSQFVLVSLPQCPRFASVQQNTARTALRQSLSLLKINSTKKEK